MRSHNSESIRIQTPRSEPKHFISYVKTLFSANGIFVDVGANIGFWLLFMAKFGKQSIGFEPFAQNVEVIESSIFHHKYNNDAWAANAEVHNFGIAEKNLVS